MIYIFIELSPGWTFNLKWFDMWCRQSLYIVREIDIGTVPMSMENAKLYRKQKR